MSNDGLSTSEKVNLLFKNFMNFTSTLDSKQFFEETALANNANIFSENILSAMPPENPSFTAISDATQLKTLLQNGMSTVDIDTSWLTDKTTQASASFSVDTANTVLRMQNIELDYVSNGGAAFICKDKNGLNILQNIIPSNYAASGYGISLNYLHNGTLKPVGWLATRSELAGAAFVGTSVNFGGALFDSKNGIITFYDVNGDPATVFGSAKFYFTATKYIGPMGVTSSSTMDVTGDATFNTNVHVEEHLNVVGDISATNIQGTLTTTSQPNIETLASVSFTNDVSFNSSVYIQYDLSATNIETTGNITTNTLTVTDLHIGNDVSINSLSVLNDSSFVSHVYVAKDLSASNIQTSENIVADGNITTNTLTVTNTLIGNDVSINSLSVLNDSSFVSHVYVAKDLSASNIQTSENIVADGNITTNTLTVTDLHIGNDVSINSLSVLNDSSFVSHVYVAKDLSASNIQTSANIVADGNITTNTLTVTDLHIGNDVSINRLSVLNDSSFNADLYVAGDLSATNIDGTITTVSQPKINTMSSLRSVGDLSSGSIAVGFGNINIGSQVITAGEANFQTTNVSALNTNGGTINADGGNITSDGGTLEVTNIKGTIQSTHASQPNITQLGVLNNLTVTNDSSFNADLYIAGDLSATNIQGTLITETQTAITSVGTLSKLEVTNDSSFNADLHVDGDLTATNIQGTLTTAAQTAITSVGTLNNLDVNATNDVIITTADNKNILLQPGGTGDGPEKVHIKGSLTVDGSINFTGGFVQTNTNVQITDQLDISNNGTGPALIARQHGTADVAAFYDDNALAMVIKGTSGEGGRVGIGTNSIPNSNYTGSGVLLSVNSPIFTNGLINITEDSFSGPAAILFSNGNTMEKDNISLITKGSNRLFIASNGDITIEKNLLVSDNLQVNGAINASKDTNTTSYLGRAAIGYAASLSDYASFAHHDRNDSSNYALLQSSVGKTFLNCTNGQSISFRVNNSEKMTLTSNGSIGIGKSAPGHKLDVNGNIRGTNLYGTLATASQPNVTTMSNLVTVGALDSGSITSGFTSIDVGTGLIAGGDLSGNKLSIESDSSFNNNLNVGGSIKAGYDTDTTSYFGSAAIGHAADYNDTASFAHIDYNTTDSYALKQDNVGETALNTASGKKLFFKENNAYIMTVAGGNVGIGSTTPGEKLDVIGSASISQKLYATDLSANKLSIEMDSSFNGDVYIGGDLSVNDILASHIRTTDLTVTGANTLRVEGKHIAEDISVNQGINVANDSSFNADLYIGGDLSATNIQASTNMTTSTLNVTGTHTGNDVNINNLTVANDSSFNADLYIGGDLSATNIQASTNMTTVTLNVTGTHTGNDVNINNLTVANDSSFNADLYIGGDLSATTIQASTNMTTVTLNVTGTHTGNDVNINNLTVANDSSFNADVYISGDLSATTIQASTNMTTSTLNVTGTQTGNDVNINNLTVANDSSFNADVYISGDLSATTIQASTNMTTATLNVTGTQTGNDVNINNLTVANDSSFNADLYIGGDLSATTIQASTNMTTVTLNVTGTQTGNDVNINNLTVANDSSFNADLYIGGDLTVENDSSFNADLYIGGDLSATNIQASTNMTTATLNVTGTQTGNDVNINNLTVANDSSFNADLYIGGDLSATNIQASTNMTTTTLNVTGTQTGNDVNINNLTVANDSSFNADVYISGDLSATTIQASTNMTTATLNVTGTQTGNDVNINNLTVANDSSFNADVYISGDLSATNIQGTLTTASQPNVNTMSGLVTVGALQAGSISSGFGSIDVGTDSISGGAITGASLNITNDLSAANIQATVNMTTSTLNVTGTHTGNDVNINNLVVANDSSFNADLYVGGDFIATNIGGTLTTASQPNVTTMAGLTSVGTLSDLNVNATNDVVITTASNKDILLQPGGHTDGNEKVHIKGDLTVDGSINFVGGFIQTNTNVQITDQLDISNNGTGPALIARQHGTANIADFYDDNTLAMRIANGGNVGIGTDSPSVALDVSGNINAANITIANDSTFNADLYVAGDLSATNIQGTLSTVNQPNITTVGILTELEVNGAAYATDISAGSSIKVGDTSITSADTYLGGIPTAPTATSATNNAQLATTAFVQSAISSGSSGSSGSSYIIDQPPVLVSISKDAQSSYVDVNWVKFSEVYKDAFTGRSYPIYLQTIVDISFTSINGESSNGWKTVHIGNGNYNTGGSETTQLNTLRFTAANGLSYTNSTGYSLSFTGKPVTDDLPVFTQDDSFDLRVYAVNNSGTVPAYIYIYNVGLKTTGAPSAVLVINTDTYTKTSFKMDTSFNLDSADTSITSGIDITNYDISYTLIQSRSQETITHQGVFDLDNYNNKNNLTFSSLKPGSKYRVQIRAKNALNSDIGPYGDAFTGTNFTNDGTNRFIDTTDLNSVSHNGMLVTKVGSASINGKIVGNDTRSSRHIFSANNNNSKIAFSNASSLYVNYGRQGTDFTSGTYVISTFEILKNGVAQYSDTMDFTNSATALTADIGATGNQYTFTSASSYTDEGKITNYSKGFVYSSSLSCTGNANTNSIFNANFPASIDYYRVNYTIASQSHNNTQRIDENENTSTSRNSENFWVDDYSGTPSITYTASPTVSIEGQTFLFGIPSITNIQLTATYSISNFANYYIPYGTISSTHNIHSKSNVSSTKNGYSFGTTTRDDIYTTPSYSTTFTKNDSSITNGTYNANSTQSLLVTVNYLNNSVTPTVATQTSTTTSNNLGKTFKDNTTSYTGNNLRFFNGSDAISGSNIVANNTSFATTYSSNISTALLYFNGRFVAGGYNNSYSATSLSPFSNWYTGYAVTGPDYSSYTNTGSNGFKWIAIQVSRSGNNVDLSDFKIGTGAGSATRHDNHLSTFSTKYRAYIYQDGKFGSLKSASNSGATSWFDTGPTTINGADSANGALQADGFNALVNSNGGTTLYLIVGIDHDSNHYFTF